MASKKMYSVVAVVGIVGASTMAWWLQTPKSDAGAPAGARAVGVEITQVKKQTLRDDAEAVGSLRSSQNVMLRPEVAGRVLSLGFADGARVRAGQVLVQMDDTLQRAEVQQSLAQMSIARANHKRNQELVAQNFIAQRSLDESAAALQVADAQLGLSCARLERMRLIAPFNGVVGIRSVNVGDYVKDGADLINLENIGSLYVDYRLPERYQTKVAPGQMIEVKLDAFSGRLFKAKVEAVDPLIDANGRSIGVRAVLSNTAGEPIAAVGKNQSQAAGAQATAVAPAASFASASPSKAVMPTASSTTVTKTEPNNRGMALPSPQTLGCPTNTFDRTRTSAGGEQNGPLRPGMFARVTAVFAVKPNALVVPEEAIVPQGGKQFVIKAVDPTDLPATVASSASAASAPALPPDTKLVSQRVEVKLGIRRGGQVEITDGLIEGDTIVVAGQQRLQKDGSPLRVVELGRGPANAASAAASGAAGAASAGASGTVSSDAANPVRAAASAASR
jgi:membrane fusion protein (multidrug efflux system)